MDREKFKTLVISKENPLVRLAILEASISEKIQISEGQQKYWSDREDAWKQQIAKKYEYHKLLSAEVEIILNES